MILSTYKSLHFVEDLQSRLMTSAIYIPPFIPNMLWQLIQRLRDKNVRKKMVDLHLIGTFFHQSGEQDLQLVCVSSKVKKFGCNTFHPNFKREPVQINEKKRTFFYYFLLHT